MYLTNELKESRMRIKKLSDLESRDKNISEKIKKQKVALRAACMGSKKRTSHGVHDILRILEKNNIVCDRVEPLGKKISKWYEKECFNISIKGEFKNLISFFDKCKNMHPLIHVKQLSMVRDAEQNVVGDLSLQIIKKVNE